MPPHAIHGTARDQPWHVAEATATVAVLDLALSAPWPFGGRVVSRVELTPNALDLRLEVHATDHPMPVACGWHPWWNRHLGVGEALEVELHADVMYRRDAEGIPTGELGEITPPPWDDCFAGLGSPAAVLRWPQALSVTMETDCPCLVVYTQPERAVCVEPESGPPDAFNLDPAVVEPGPPLVVTTTWRWAVDGASR
jgi:galactose mutarotase-like enzyme